MAVSKKAIVSRLSRYMKTIEWGKLNNSRLDRFLYQHFPHVRMQGIGDSPMIWFSVSRVNPPHLDHAMRVAREIDFLNEIVLDIQSSIHRARKTARYKQSLKDAQISDMTGYTPEYVTWAVDNADLADYS